MVNGLGHAAWLKLRERARALDDDRLAVLSPMLILAPHQDDETLGCGGLLATASRLGLKPRVAYLTDGSASHLGSPAWTAERLSQTRRSESLAALAVLGVPETDVCFLEWPDAQPFDVGSPAYERSLVQLTYWATRFGPRSVWSPWPQEDHCDHAAAAHLALDLAGRLRSSPVRMDYLVWGWSKPQLSQQTRGAIWALDCPDTVDARTRALACHRTQLGGLIRDAEKNFQIPPELAALTARPTEIYLEGA